MQHTARMINFSDITTLLVIACLILLTALAIVLFFLISKTEEFRELKFSFDRMMASFNELDEQAKLVVQTDLELNRAQEELERRVLGMNVLQQFARRASMSLNENEIFQKIDPQLVSELGFAKAMAVTIDNNRQFICRASIGVAADKVLIINNSLANEPGIISPLEKGLTVSSAALSGQEAAFVRKVFDCEHFILSPLIAQRKLAGFLFFGNDRNAPQISAGDEELITILGNQLASALENSRLFEQVYLSSQTLETKVNERTRELSQALKAVEEVSRKKTEFVSAVSHELRTPLTSIKGYASILMTGKVGAIPDPVKERLGKINTHSDNLVKLINDLLDISRIESGRVEMKTTPKDIRLLVENVADMLLPQVNGKGLSIKINIAADTPPIEIDQTQVERVFINLIGNATKFTSAGGVISVNAHMNWPKDEAIFEVADTGIGIKKEDLSRLFSEFFRVDNEINMSVKGTGLGLVLARNIVQAHHGRMWVTSEVGHGTTFHFTLPVKHKPLETTA